MEPTVMYCADFPERSISHFQTALKCARGTPDPSSQTCFQSYWDWRTLVITYLRIWQTEARIHTSIVYSWLISQIFSIESHLPF